MRTMTHPTPRTRLRGVGTGTFIPLIGEGAASPSASPPVQADVRAGHREAFVAGFATGALVVLLIALTLLVH